MGRKIIAIFRFFLRRPKIEREVDAELRFHLDHLTEENQRRGMTPEQARRAASLALGGMEQVKEDCRDARAGRFVEAFGQDVRYGLRVLRKNPGFATVAMVTLALGIGVNTAIFSLVYGVLLRPLPYRHGGQLVVLHQQNLQAHATDIPFSAQEIFDYRDRSHTLDAVVEHHTMDFLLLGNDTAERVHSAVVSANFFDVLGVRPLLGRTFAASDDSPNADPVLVLSYQYWQAHQSGDPHIVGKVFRMNDRQHTVIGVLPPIPQYPAESDVYMPVSACPFRSAPAFIANRRARMMTAFGRLKPGVRLQEAQADLSVVASQIASAHPDVYPKSEGYGLAAAPLRDDLTRRARTTFWVLLGGAGFVLLIACANVANLLMARLLKLERELAVRAALGASKARLSRQLITESVLLSLGGGILGLALAPATLSLLVKFAERLTTRAVEVRLDTPVLLFTLLISLLTGVLFGLAPAASLGQRFGEALQQGGRTTASRGRQGLRASLLIAQVAVSFILLIGAGLMVRSFLKLQHANPGFNPDHVLSLRISPSFSAYSHDQLLVLTDKILQRVGTIGAVQSVALASNIPFSPDGIAAGPGDNNFEIEGRPVSQGELAPSVDVSAASPAYFETIRQPLVKGRAFTGHDDAKNLQVVIINQSMARHRWPAEDPIGRRVSFDHGAHWLTIVGIVGDVKEYGLARPVGDELYAPISQTGFGGGLMVRTAVDPLAVAPLVRAAIHDVDPHIAVDGVVTMERLEYDSIAPPRVTAILLGLFAGLALLISASGIASVMALSVSQRTHELGIRMALGARRSSVVGMVVRRGFLLALAGSALGMAGAVVLTHMLSTLLYATSPTDIFTFLSVSALFLSVAALACFLPARQVTAIDPLEALRQE